MTDLRNPLCLLRCLYRSLRCRAWVSGHEFREAEYETPANVQVLVCDTCGAESVAWSMLEDAK
jgi:hypothetical protein